MNTQNVAFVRDDVTEMLPRWKRIRDCLGGSSAVKAARDEYLPIPNAKDTTAANEERYEAYLERAVFYGVTQRTLKALVGQVFQKDPILVLPSQLEAIEADASGAGVALLQQAKKTLGMTVGYGRCGLLVDYPTATEAASRAQILSGEMRPVILLYDPPSIINWRYTTIGAKSLLSMLVIHESMQEESDGFELQTVEQYRELRLAASPEGGVEVVARVWREDSAGKFVPSEDMRPKVFDGSPLREIPFTFVGSENNDATIDIPPLADLVELNLAHYRNSADWEESVYLCGQPTPVVAGVSEAWVAQQMGGSLKLGSRTVIPLPAGATASLLQANPSQLPLTAMESKEKQMAALGAKLVEPVQVQRTATEARQALAAELSVLGTCAKNVGEAYKRAFSWCGLFAGASEPGDLLLEVDYDFGRMSAQDRQQTMADMQGGLLSFTEARQLYEKAGLTSLTAEEAKDEIENTMSFGVPTGSAATDTQADANADDTTTQA